MSKKELIIEAGLNLIPYAGGALASVYTHNKDNKRFERIEEFYQNVQIQMQHMEEELIERINIENHNPDLLAILIEKQNETIETEYISMKKQFLQSFFINNLIMETTEKTYDKKLMYLDALKNLNYSELEILSLLFQVNKPQQISGIEFLDDPEQDRYAIVAHINRIRNFGFIEMHIGNFTIGGKLDNIHESFVAISDFGKEFVNFCLL